MKWTQMRDGFRVSGVYTLKWWRDPDGREYLVHTHGCGSCGDPYESAVWGRDLLSGRMLSVLLYRERRPPVTCGQLCVADEADEDGGAVVEHETTWEVGEPDPTWADVRRLTGIQPKVGRGGYEHLEDSHHDGLYCHPVAIASYAVMQALNLPAQVLTCPECCKDRDRVEYSWKALAEEVADAADGTSQAMQLLSDDSMVGPDTAPIAPVTAWRSVFDETANTQRFCSHGKCGRWTVEQAWAESGWARAVEYLPTAVEKAQIQLEHQRRGEMNSDGQMKLVMA